MCPFCMKYQAFKQVDGYSCAKTSVSYVEGHEIAQKSKFVQKNVITVKELLNILNGKSWNKY